MHMLSSDHDCHDTACHLALADVKRRLKSTEARLLQRDRDIDELNHRIANSLQLVSSFLAHQQRGLRERAAKDALAIASTRIVAVAKLHRHLASAGPANMVKLDCFLSELGPELASSTGLDCRVEADPLEVTGETAMQIAVAINELVINARKHAYADSGDGVVCIKATNNSDDGFVVSVKDEGSGLPSEFDLSAPHGLGLHILQALAVRLGAALTATSEGGALFSLRVPSGQTHLNIRSYSASGTP